MEWVTDLYAAQPFWIWLAIAALILAVEAAIGSEWLLWPAVAAGIVAVLTAIGLPLGLVGELIVFAILTIIGTVFARRLVKRINPTESDINARDSRLVGQRATVVQAFVGGQGRIFISGAEWAAELMDGASASPLAGDAVVVEDASGTRLKVRPV
ncbi:NfeD family protein [Brevundimonas lutea]|uniref:NfeD family protein n=1 Tax=Brevundimonas lutea TaxID=2293980 RepID=UPI000F018012|nr:NfeD family protein [Brevundimonas lutea]